MAEQCALGNEGSRDRGLKRDLCDFFFFILKAILFSLCFLHFLFVHYYCEREICRSYHLLFKTVTQKKANSMQKC